MPKRIVFKVGLNWLDLIIVIAIPLLIVYFFEIWKWNTFVNKRLYLYLAPIVLFLYLYWQFRITIYILYDDVLVVKFPLRPIYNKIEIFIQDIESVIFKSINTTGVYSSVDIKVKNRKKRYHFSSTKDEKTEQLIEELKKMGIPIQIDRIAGF
jgi:phosphoglycerol transferase MdoB-like AlkP superfamily enzyme